MSVNVWKRGQHPEAVKSKPKNTESFVPDYNPPQLQIRLANGNWGRYPYVIKPYDVILVPGLVGDVSYEGLKDEVPADDMLSWHGDTHWIADDKSHWKKNAPIFKSLVDKTQDFFNMDVNATRFNLYDTIQEWKPYHHDAAALDPEKAKNQNITVGISFGATRSISFQQNGTNTRVDIPLEHGMVYAFGNQVNSLWKHGVPPVCKDTIRTPGLIEGRISVIAWGFVNQENN